jgi:hypothetical protein
MIPEEPEPETERDQYRTNNMDSVYPEHGP